MKEDLEDRFYLGPLSIDIQGDKEIGDRYVNTAKSMLTMLKMRMNNVGITYGMDSRSIAVFAKEGGKQTHWAHLKVLTNRNGLVDQDKLIIRVEPTEGNANPTKRILGYIVKQYVSIKNRTQTFNVTTPSGKLLNNHEDFGATDYDYVGYTDNGAKYVTAQPRFPEYQTLEGDMQFVFINDYERKLNYYGTQAEPSYSFTPYTVPENFIEVSEYIEESGICGYILGIPKYWTETTFGSTGVYAIDIATNLFGPAVYTNTVYITRYSHFYTGGHHLNVFCVRDDLTNPGWTHVNHADDGETIVSVMRAESQAIFDQSIDQLNANADEWHKYIESGGIMRQADGRGAIFGTGFYFDEGQLVITLPTDEYGDSFVYMFPNGDRKQFSIDSKFRDNYEYETVSTSDVSNRSYASLLAPSNGNLSYNLHIDPGFPDTYLDTTKTYKLTDDFGIPVTVEHGIHTVRCYIDNKKYQYEEDSEFTKFEVYLLVEYGDKMTIERYDYTDERDDFPKNNAEFKIFVGDIEPHLEAGAYIKLGSYED